MPLVEVNRQTWSSHLIKCDWEGRDDKYEPCKVDTRCIKKNKQDVLDDVPVIYCCTKTNPHLMGWNNDFFCWVIISFAECLPFGEGLAGKAHPYSKSYQLRWLYSHGLQFGVGCGLFFSMWASSQYYGFLTAWQLGSVSTFMKIGGSSCWPLVA